MSSNKIPNCGPGLGNIAFDPVNDQLFVTNFEDGEIYQITGLSGTAGTIKKRYLLQGVPDTAAGFADKNLTTTDQYRKWAIAVANKRVYYSLWRQDRRNQTASRRNEIWSVLLDAAGDITGRPVLLVTPSLFMNNASGQWSSPISDIEFSADGKKMLVAERTMWGDVGQLYVYGGSP